jgi:PIN domain nuclease of toxin-antitoxin system
VTAYLDTQIVVWLVSSNHRQLSAKAHRTINQADTLFVSPMVELELQYLNEIGRIRLGATDIVEKLSREIDLKVCGIAFRLVAALALKENWTRNPFDRIIVAQAKANGVSPLITSDQRIRANYANAIW